MYFRPSEEVESEEGDLSDRFEVRSNDDRLNVTIDSTSRREDDGVYYQVSVDCSSDVSEIITMITLSINGLGDIGSYKAGITDNLPDDIEVRPKTNNLKVGDSRQLKVEVQPSGAYDEFQFRDRGNYYDEDTGETLEPVVRVDRFGVVTAIREGTTEILVMSADSSVNDTVTVNVTES